MCGGGGGGGVSRSAQTQRTQPRPSTDFTRPEVKKQRENPFADDTMEGARATVAKKKVAKPAETLVDKIKKQLPDVGSMVDDIKKKIFPSNPPAQVAPVASPPAATAPVTHNPVRVV